MTTPLFLLRKSVDWSLLRQGFSVPTEYLSLWQNLPGGRLERGERRQVRFYLDGVMYDDATLINQKFDESKYEGHADVFQIRYNEGSALVKKLRQIFASSFKYIEAERIARGGKSKSPIRVPEELQEFVVFSAWQDQYVIYPHSLVMKHRTSFSKQTCRGKSWHHQSATQGY